MNLEEMIHDLACRARAASDRLAELSTRDKDAWLLRSAERLEAARERILSANREDLREAEEKGVAGPLVRRRGHVSVIGNDGMPNSLPTPSRLARPVACSSEPMTENGTMGVSLSSARRMKPRPNSWSW